ncbi:MAG: type I DNA topoisomerase [Desulfobacteraceae bacterium]|nr:type I DNA topoisomerase [Desulfobacteraceae bacterium]MDH3575909.1 type I DNA topoisomerase [Desulfobacteraceae bacterium]MDH3720268.1 type I DNA topoisomerase [Desulfobacteraceae bacterium]MDH3836034.1 type I DNA topoisomerase [Desulfobacteraceae bacterium]MDH3872840.1 type I DNA topoisomerase [Desulfobacteraceae bacterium]
MSKPLVIVESPTKIRTIKKYLGKEYNVAATVGHIKDLPAKEIGINIEEGFKPKYTNIPGKQKVIKSLRQAAGDTTDIYLAPDPDREGEAIAWHTADILKKKGRIFHRVLFHELTQNAIHEAIKSPDKLNQNKYEAQQARRILDRLVGYQISPLLWRKVKGGLSAGRVQSVAVRIICDRERAIQAFESEEYWSITAHLEDNSPPPFTAKLVKKNGNKIKIPDEKASNGIIEELSDEKFIVEKIQKKTVKRNPSPPFITSKLQQEAIRKLRFSAKKTMIVAQQLYEGIELSPGEPEGLITYMRTDSTRISKEAAMEALKLVRDKFGDEYALEKPRFFKNRKKAQDAHEAIRPTSVFNTPEKIKPFLSKDQFALYELVWKRFVASQMKQALMNKISISIAAGPYLFTASGSSVAFPGFMTLYMTTDDQIESDSQKKKDDFPELSEGGILKLNKLEPKQHFTMPPPRFSEASLVKELEENGIGRPSTYAAILSTIREKGYVDLVKGYFKPNELGFIVNDLLVKSFPDVLDVEFTANMENDLDRIEAAEVDYSEILRQFYDAFEKELEAASTGMLSVKGIGFPTDLTCPQCNHRLHIRMGRNGQFLGCNNYPECTYTRNYTRDEKGVVHAIEPSSDQPSDKICDKCGKPMLIKDGRYGTFFACSGYPDCKTTLSTNSIGSGEKTGVDCPEQDCNGELVQRSSKRGKIFYGCSRFPDCTFATWDKPVAKECPECGAKFLVEKTTKKQGTFLTCNTKGCGFKVTSE